MSGHSKWHSIKHKKGATDAKRGKLFTRLLKEVMISARMGGGDPDANPRLRAAIQAAKDSNMPKDNINRAVKRATGEMDGVSYEDFIFEGYGPGGTAFLVEGSTDNRNRTTPEIRFIFSKLGGNLGETGCVAWMFSRRSVIVAEFEGLDEDAAMEIALEAGADDFEFEEGIAEIMAAPDELMSVREGLEAKGVKILEATVRSIPANTVKVEGKAAETLVKLVNALEDQDDVTSVAGNYELDPDLAEQLS